MKKKATLIMLFLLVISSHGYEVSMLNMQTPSTLTAPAFQLSFQHRLYDIIRDGEFTLFEAASVAMNAQIKVYHGLDLTLNYHTSDKNIDISGGYSYVLIKRWLDINASFHYFIFQKYHVPSNKYRTNAGVFSCVSFMSELFLNYLWVLGNISYDWDKKYFCESVGATITITDWLETLGELYLTKNENELGPAGKKLYGYSTYSVGLKINTYAHHFKIFLTNCDEIGPRRAGAGAKLNTLRMGFSIQRLFQ